MPADKIFRPIGAPTIETVLQFVQSNAITSAHYFGSANEGLIRALRAEPGFTITLTDYFERWGCSQRFWGNDEGEDYPIPPCPEWLKDLDCYEEGMAPASLLVWDLPKPESEKLTRGTRVFDFIALAGEATYGFWPMLNYARKREAGTWLGTRKRPADLRQKGTCPTAS